MIEPHRYLTSISWWGHRVNCDATGVVDWQDGEPLLAPFIEFCPETNRKHVMAPHGATFSGSFCLITWKSTSSCEARSSSLILPVAKVLRAPAVDEPTFLFETLSCSLFIAFYGTCGLCQCLGSKVTRVPSCPRARPD